MELSVFNSVLSQYKKRAETNRRAVILYFSCSSFGEMFDKRDNSFEREINRENSNGNERRRFKQHLRLELIYHQRNGSCESVCQERYRRNRHHTVDKEIRERFQNRGFKSGNKNIKYHMQSANAQSRPDSLQIAAQFAHTVVEQQIRRREEVNTVYKYKDCERSVNERAFERKHVRKTEYHTRNSKRGYRKQVQNPCGF